MIGSGTQKVQWHDELPTEIRVEVEAYLGSHVVRADTQPGGSLVPKADLLPVAAALAGFFLWNSLEPAPPRLVTLRGFQRSQGDVLVGWLKDGW